MIITTMKDSKPFNVILLGDPAAGKATQAARLVKKYHLYDFDMGKEIRKPAVRAKHDYAGTTGKGKLTPTKVVRKILYWVTKKVPARQGILFDGHPKMIGEAKLLAGWLREFGRTDPLVLYLNIPPVEMLRRVSKRKQYWKGKLIRRDDDAETALRNRQKYYRDQVARVIAFFREKYAFKKISGIGTREEVWKRIDAAVKQYVDIH